MCVFHLRRLGTKAAVILLLGWVGLVLSGVSQTTNSIPANLFLTDDGQVFWHQNGKTVVAVNKIEEAKRSTESRPADEDPEGHWGPVTNGLQLSIRFEKTKYVTGEPITAILLIRNVSDKQESYPRAFIGKQPSPIEVTVLKGDKQLELKDKNGLLVVSATEVSLHPQSQHKYEVKLDHFFDLSQVGEYDVQAHLDMLVPGQREKHKLVSGRATIAITNSP